MLYMKTIKLLLVYCHSTLTDNPLSKKSKIISFNFNEKDPTPVVYFSNFQAPASRGKIMKTNKNESFLYLAECENSGNHSNCHLRVLGGLGPTQAKLNYLVKINGVLKEFDIIDNDTVIILTNDNKI